ncbi:hypothetical protein [Nesterenkonia halotolerans]|uniref:Uncharacterized protein n=1 Tax=Nesterenkonia halotolerans TaxID=225325 RepID=A0ABR9J9V1_9MICC|nr:hypothetical protein [Nesterenkonia halotolerans]MBE1515754.1 hypothetical protein [Nesterenkonia halotolerans]
MRRKHRAAPEHQQLGRPVEAESRANLGQGRILIEAAVRARLLGFQLLRLDAEVVLTPVRAAPPPLATGPVPGSEPGPPPRRVGRERPNPEKNPGSRSRREPPWSPLSAEESRPGASMAAARRLLEEADRSLEQAKDGNERRL